MHQEYTAGYMMMVDFAGKKLNYVLAGTGEVVECQVFVAILPYSGLIFCHAVHSQQTADFMGCINAMLAFYGAVPNTIYATTLKLPLPAPAVTNPFLPTFACSWVRITTLLLVPPAHTAP